MSATRPSLGIAATRPDQPSSGCRKGQQREQQGEAGAARLPTRGSCSCNQVGVLQSTGHVAVLQPQSGELLPFWGEAQAAGGDGEEPSSPGPWRTPPRGTPPSPSPKAPEDSGAGEDAVTRLPLLCPRETAQARDSAPRRQSWPPRPFPAGPQHSHTRLAPGCGGGGRPHSHSQQAQVRSTIEALSTPSRRGTGVTPWQGTSVSPTWPPVTQTPSLK